MAVRWNVLNISSWLYYFWNDINVHNESLLMMRTKDMDAFLLPFRAVAVLCTYFDDFFFFCLSLHFQFYFLHSNERQRVEFLVNRKHRTSYIKGNNQRQPTQIFDQRQQ